MKRRRGHSRQNRGGIVHTITQVHNVPRHFVLIVYKFDMSDQSSFDKPRIGVLGLGHVGLPTVLGFVEMGW